MSFAFMNVVILGLYFRLPSSEEILKKPCLEPSGFVHLADKPAAAIPSTTSTAPSIPNRSAVDLGQKEFISFIP